MKQNLNFDLIVLGAGSAGTACAYRAAKEGLRTLLVEKNGFCGGTLSAALVTPMLSFHSGRKQIVFGFAQALIERLQKKRGSLGHLRDPLGFAPSITPIEPELLKLEQEKLCQEAGVTFLYHATLSGVKVESEKKQKHLRQISVIGQGEKLELTASYFVDASGDGELAAQAGASFSYGGAHKEIQPLTAFFKIQKVEIEELTAYQKKHRHDFILAPDFDKIFYPGTSIIYPGICGFFSLIEKEKEKGFFPLERDRVLLFGGVKIGEVSVNMTRVSRAPLKMQDLSIAEEEGRKQIEICFDFLQKYLPGFKKAELAQLPATIGIRESRRIHGLYMLTEKDVLLCRKFSDGIARSAYPIDIHIPHSSQLTTKKLPYGDYYEIPLRSLIVRGFANLGVAGRCASFTHTALSSARVSAQCFAMGEALGLALAQAAKQKKSLPEIAFAEIKRILLDEEKKFSHEPLAI